MKQILIYILAITTLVPLIAFAECEVKLEWDPETDSEVAGYMLFCREDGEDYNYDDPVWEGDSTFTQCSIDGLEESKTYFFVIRAVDAKDQQSYDSNEIEFLYTPEDAGVGGDGFSSTNYSSCFIQSLF